jgi:hypothetical protein
VKQSGCSLGAITCSTIVVRPPTFHMFLVHQLQALQERLVLDTQSYVDHNLLRHMQSRGGA